jgi:hypothetical protein
VLFVVGVSDGLNEIVKPWDAPAVFRRTGKPTIGADRILRTRINRKLCEFSAEVRKSEAVALADPVMPVFDGLGG